MFVSPMESEFADSDDSSCAVGFYNCTRIVSYSSRIVLVSITPRVAETAHTLAVYSSTVQ
jgi:hypothetical protein